MIRLDLPQSASLCVGLKPRSSFRVYLRDDVTYTVLWHLLRATLTGTVSWCYKAHFNKSLPFHVSRWTMKEQQPCRETEFFLLWFHITRAVIAVMHICCVYVCTYIFLRYFRNYHREMVLLSLGKVASCKNR